MDREQLVILCEITGDMLQEHTLFDIFYRRKRWKNPALFAAILVAFSIVCFVVGAVKNSGLLLGWLLLIIGLGLPAVYIGSYVSRLKAQTKQLTRKKLTLNFTVKFGKDGVTIIKGDKQETYQWDTVVHAYRLRQVLCLYFNEQQALLLPTEVTAWARICSALPQEKVTDVKQGSAKS